MPLSDLIAALAAATGPSRELDAWVAHDLFGWRHVRERGNFGRAPGRNGWPPIPEYTSSLDAITGAVEQRWPGAKWSVDSGRWATIEVRLYFKAVNGGCATPALALCLAAARLAAAESADAR